jgi:hypothetical protein
VPSAWHSGFASQVPVKPTVASPHRPLCHAPRETPPCLPTLASGFRSQRRNPPGATGQTSPTRQRGIGSRPSLARRACVGLPRRQARRASEGRDPIPRWRVGLVSSQAARSRLGRNRGLTPLARPNPESHPTCPARQRPEGTSPRCPAPGPVRFPGAAQRGRRIDWENRNRGLQGYDCF